MTVSDSVAPEYAKYVARQRAEGLLPPPKPRDTGQIGDDIRLDPGSAVELMRVAALRAAGIFRPTKRTTIAWVDGGNQLAIIVAELDLEFADGLVAVVVPVRCDQVEGKVRVTFAVGSPDRPRGLYAATEKRPRGPQLVVDVWGERPGRLRLAVPAGPVHRDGGGHGQGHPRQLPGAGRDRGQQ